MDLRNRLGGSFLMHKKRPVRWHQALVRVRVGMSDGERFILVRIPGGG